MTEKIKKHIVFSLILLMYIAINLIITPHLTKNYTDIYQPDSGSYIQAAKNLIQYGTLSQASSPPLEPDSFRTPGYPMLIASVFKIFGENLKHVIILQIIFSSIILFLIYYLTYLYSRNIKYAIFTSALYIFEHLHYYYDRVVLTENFFTLLIVTACFFLIMWQREKKDKNFYIFALLINLALLARPVLYYFNILLLVFFLIMYIKKKLDLRYALVYALIFFVCIGGWMGRNYLHFGRAIFSTVTEFNLLVYRGAFVLSEVEQKPLDYEQKKVYDQVVLNPANSGLNGVELSEKMKEKGLDIIKEHPFVYAKIHLKGTIGLLFGKGEILFSRKNALDFTADIIKMFGSQHAFLRFWDLKNFQNYHVILYKYFSLMLMVAAFMSVTLYIYFTFTKSLIKNYNNMGITEIIFVSMILYLIIISGPEGYSRFRVPIMPLMIILLPILKAKSISPNENLIVESSISER